jgi:hypothetical protein
MLCKWALLVSCLFTQSIFADSPDTVPEGSTYTPIAKEATVEQVLDVIRVYSASQYGKAYLEKLRGAGYACRPVMSSLWRCSKHLSSINNDEDEVKRRIQTQVSKLSVVSFGILRGKASLTHESDAYNEWEIPQKISLGENLKADYYRLRHLQGTEYLKLLPGKQGKGKEYIWNGRKLFKILNFAISNKEGFTRYMVQSSYK